MKGNSTKPTKERNHHYENKTKKDYEIPTLRVRTVSLVAAAMTFSTPEIARAQNSPPPCGVQTLHSSYIFATSGYNVVNGVAVPKAIVEGIDFNGDGTLISPFATVSLNGVIIRSAGSTGTYTVAADCTGTITFDAGPTFDTFVDAKGRQLWMIMTGPAAVPAVFEGVATRVPSPAQ